MSITLYRKYRPLSFADVTEQEHVKRTLRNQLEAGTVAHAYLFIGPRGVGKTTIARIFARAINCGNRKGGEPCNECSSCKEILENKSFDLVEMDAASHTGVDNVRENIIENVRFAPAKLKYKVFVIDEVHMLSTGAFNALLKTIEEPPPHAMFILATTEIHKVPATIVSRCQRFDFRRISVPGMVKRLKEMANEEGFTVDDEVLAMVSRAADGCERDAESLLGQLLSLGEKNVTRETAALVLPGSATVQVAELLACVAKQDAAGALSSLNKFVEEGVDAVVFLDELIETLRAMLLSSLGANETLDRMMGGAVRTQVLGFVKEWGMVKIVGFLELCLDARRGTRLERIPQLPLELALVEMCIDIPVLPLAPPVPPAPLAPSTFIPISVSDLERQWPKVFERIKEVNATLPLIIQTGKILSINGNEVEMGFQYRLHADTVNQAKNQAMLGSILLEVLSCPLRIKGIYALAEADAATSDILEQFGGTVA
ncbi:DNA polymerase III subunit gamma/tau [Candidatus Uhrbacteria bacterium]|nr:DNA polymerase III subunit gamma/tau [Candidatus Uhrbacteria bacterium]